MKTKSLLLFATLMVTLGVTSCSSSSDDEGGNNGNGNNSSSSKRITKVIEEESNSIYESTLSYDSQGRVVKTTTTQYSAGTNSRTEKTYQYGETLIVTKESREGTWSNGQAFSSTESHSYSLKDGLIVKDVENRQSSSMVTTYEYDANGCLVSVSEERSGDSSYNETIVWNNGNISKFGNYSYTYSNIPWMKGLPELFGYDLENILFSMGYYGKLPKNLPSSVSDGWTFDYTLQDNYVTKIVSAPKVEDNKHHITTISIIWE